MATPVLSACVVGVSAGPFEVRVHDWSTAILSPIVAARDTWRLMPVDAISRSGNGHGYGPRRGSVLCSVGHMGSSYESQITVAMDLGAARYWVHEVLSGMPHVRAVREGPGVLNASVPVNWASWGEKIDVSLTKSPGGTDVVVRSQCAFPFQILDWGKNKRNVDWITRRIEVPGAARPSPST